MYSKGLINKISRFFKGTAGESEEFKLLKVCQGCEFRISLEKLLKSQIPKEQPKGTTTQPCKYQSSCLSNSTCNGDLNKCIAKAHK